MTEDEHVSLKEYMESKFKAVEDRFTSVDMALTLAREQLEKRLEGMNEFRGALRDSQQNFITRTEYGIQCSRMEDKLDMAMKGKISWTVATVVTILTAGVVGLGVALLKAL